MQAESSGKEYMLTLPGITAPTGFFDPLVRRALPAPRRPHAAPPRAALPAASRRAPISLTPSPPPPRPSSPAAQGFTDSATFTVSEAKRFREAEVTHGRVAMLATLGWLLAEEYHPFFGGQIGGPAFRHFQEVEEVFPQFWEIVLLAIGISESYRIGVGYNNPKDVDQIKADYNPGGERLRCAAPPCPALPRAAAATAAPPARSRPSPRRPLLPPQRWASTPWACSPRTTRPRGRSRPRSSTTGALL
jgi:light-harvesting complex I chlorophyll a/b binding protein 1